MPRANGKIWRHCRAEMDLTSKKAAELLDIEGGSLRVIETKNWPVSLRLAYRASRLYRIPVDDLLLDGEDAPKEPKREKPEPKIEKVGPDRRRNGKDDRRGPKRAQGAAA